MESKPAGYLSNSEFESVIRFAPLVAIDLIVRRKDGRVLLGYRKNEPAKGMNFVPGGRIMKNETVDVAFNRIARSELGIEKHIREARFLGIYDHVYNTNVFQKPGFGTHYLVLAHEICLDETPSLPNDQHDKYEWWSEAEILTSDDVHENTKAYFK